VVGVAAQSPAPIRWFGEESSEATWRVEDIAPDGALGSRAVLVGPDGRAPIRLRAPGRHLLLDAAAAAAVASCFGVGIAEAARRIGEFAPAEHRGEVMAGLRGSTLVDDSYNSSPTSLAAALEGLRVSGAPERLAIIGDMLELGDRTLSAHREAGRHAAGAATRLIAVGEQAEVVAAAAVAAGMPAAAVAQAADADGAAELALPLLRPGSVVLVKGSRGIGLERVVKRLLA
jgi:UDP-N-acetylmuramoyl-tripeptide--D-alanyl-D-alanine ligase